MGFSRFNLDQDDTTNALDLGRSEEIIQSEGLVTQPEEVSIFSKGLIIDGNVSVESPLLMKGKVNGNLFCKQSIDISDDAQINGEVHAKALNLNNGKIYGDVKVKDQSVLQKGTYIKGNISSNTLDINGMIEGDIYAQSEISFFDQANIQGDINALSISIEKGALISGAMNVGEDARKVAEERQTQENVDEIIETIVEEEIVEEVNTTPLQQTLEDTQVSLF